MRYMPKKKCPKYGFLALKIEASRPEVRLRQIAVDRATWLERYASGKIFEYSMHDFLSLHLVFP